jgi:hypothetical protein
MIRSSQIRSLLLARLQAGIGLTQDAQSWISRAGYVRRRWYYLCAAADKFVGDSPSQYLQAVTTRETSAIHSLKPPKQIALFCGSKFYLPETEKKFTALAWYRQIVDALIPKDTTITKPYLWHDDLHDDNIFVNPKKPRKDHGYH